MDEKKQMMTLLADACEEKLASARGALANFHRNPPPEEYLSISAQALNKQIEDLERMVDCYRSAVPKNFSTSSQIEPTAILVVARLNLYPETELPHPHRKPHETFRAFVPFEPFFESGREPGGKNPKTREWPLELIDPGYCLGLKQGDIFKIYHGGSVDSNEGFWFYRILEIH